MGRKEIADQKLLGLYGEKHFPLEKTDPDFSAIKERFLYGEVYAHGYMDSIMRELIIIAVAVTNQTVEIVSAHTEAALNAGAKPIAIKETVYHCAPYIGLGKAEKALDAVNRIFKEHHIPLPVESQGTVTEENRLEKGIAAQKLIFGAHIDEMRAAAAETQKHLQDYLSAYCFGDIYTRNGLDIKQRELLTFCILCTLGGCESQLKSHIKGNAAVDNRKGTLLDALTVCLPFIGFPRTLNALACMNEILPD